MLSSYVQVLRTPGALAFVAAGFVARLPMSMVGLGAVLLVRAATGSYALAGAVSATFALATALGPPQTGRLIDRFGQRRVLVPVLAIHVAGVLGLLAAVGLDAPRPVLFACALVAGAAFPAMGSLVRARWTALLRGGQGLQTAFALESVLDDVIFVIGPVLATTLATTVAPAAGLLAALAFVLVGGAAFVAQRATEPPVARGRRPGGTALRIPGLAVLALVLLGLGGVFGTLEVAMVAFAEERGHAALTGPLLALHALTSAVAGILYGARRWTLSPDRRLLVAVAAMWLGTVPLALAGELGTMAVALVISGVTISPLLIAGFQLVEVLVPRAALTEGFAWLSSSIGVGVALGFALGGRVAESAGGQRAFLVCIAAGAVAVLASLAGRRPLAARRDD